MSVTMDDTVSQIQKLIRYKNVAKKLFSINSGILPCLNRNNVSIVAIYGMGDIGRYLADALTSLGISVYCGIDKRPVAYKNYRIFSVQEFNELSVSVDIIIVTPFYEYEFIKQSFAFKYQKLCISIEQLAMETVMLAVDPAETSPKYTRISDKPKISVIMPVYNAEKYIHQAINCILNQTFPDFELLIINDYPTDSTMDIVRRIEDERIRIIDNDRNRGIAFSRNKGLEEARGEYIALMDHDDLCSAYRFEVEAAYLDSHPDIDIVGSAYSAVDEENNILWNTNNPWLSPLRIKAELMFYCTVANSSAMFRKSFVTKNQLSYKDNFMGMEDYNFWVEASKYGRIANLNDVLYTWRCLSSNESANIRKNKEEERKIKFSEIQRKALKKNGADLTEDEFEVFNSVFAEHKTEKESFENLQKVYCVLKKIIIQTNRSENAKEIQQACKKHFMEKLTNSMFVF